MERKLKEIFDQVQAEEELKEQTKAFLRKKTKGYTKGKSANYRHFVPALTCLLFVLFGGHWFYFTPTVEISIDVNPSIELGINRFDKVVSVDSYNDDGQELVDSLDVKYMDYAEAMDQILQNEMITSLLSNDEIMTIGVIGSEGEQSSQILADLESCTAEEQNAYCYYAQSEKVEAAHEVGLSYGKYRAFLTLQELDPDITVETIRNMTMREIWNLIAELSPDDANETYTDNGNGHGRQGTGNGYGRGQGKGKH